MSLAPIDAFLMLEEALTEPQKKRLQDPLAVLRQVVDPFLRKKNGAFWQDPEAKSTALTRRRENQMNSGKFIVIEWRDRDHNVTRREIALTVREVSPLIGLRPNTIASYMSKGGGTGIISTSDGYITVRRNK